MKPVVITAVAMSVLVGAVFYLTTVKPALSATPTAVPTAQPTRLPSPIGYVNPKQK